MEVHLTLEQEALLKASAVRENRLPNDIVRDAVAAYLDHESWFAEAVEEGRRAAKRGDVLDHEEVARRINRQLRSS